MRTAHRGSPIIAWTLGINCAIHVAPGSTLRRSLTQAVGDTLRKDKTGRYRDKKGMKKKQKPLPPEFVSGAERRLRHLLQVVGRNHQSYTNGLGPLANALLQITNSNVPAAKAMISAALAQLKADGCGYGYCKSCGSKLPLKILNDQPWLIVCSTRCEQKFSRAPKEVARPRPSN